MPRLTRLKMRRRRWGTTLEVEVDGELWAEIDDEIAAKEGLGRGKEFSEDQLAVILDLSQRRMAQKRAVGWLAGRVRTKRQTATYLRRAGYNGELARETADWCAERGLIDEARYAEAWTRRRVREGRVGPRVVEAELRVAGVGEEERVAAREELDDEEAQIAKCVRQIGRRSAFRDASDPHKSRRKARDFLLRRGFSSRVVRAALEQHFASLPGFGGDGSGYHRGGDDDGGGWQGGA